MPGSEKRGPRRGRGRSKRPREQDVEENSPTPRDPLAPPTPSSVIPFPPDNYSASSMPSYSNFGPPRPYAASETRSRSAAGPPSAPLTPSIIPTAPMRAPPGKVAIPSITASLGSQSTRKGSKKGRTSHACNVCRKAKAGCTGDQPCTRCNNLGVPCIYGDGKRDKERKRLSKLSKETDSLSQHNNEVAEALRRMRFDETLTSDAMRSLLDDILAMTPSRLNISSDEERDTVSAEASRRNASELGEKQGSGDEDDEGDDIGSIGSLDAVNIDADREENRATGHMGKSSSVSWVKRAVDEIKEDNKMVRGAGANEVGFTSSTYHIEDKDVEHVEPDHVDLFYWPDSTIADTYVQSYFDHVHQYFPILNKAQFLNEYNDFRRGARDINRDQRIWLCTLNTIFAISSYYAQVTEIQNIESHLEHLIFCARARGLCKGDDFLYSDVTIRSFRALGLLSLYFVTTDRINRAWLLCGLAMKQALTLGLNIRSEATELSDIAKEHRVRMWWSLYSIECSLVQLTGRPACISPKDISTPLPRNSDVDNLKPRQSLYKYGEENASSRDNSTALVDRQAGNYKMLEGVGSSAYSYPVAQQSITSATCFVYRTQLTTISHAIASELYCASVTKEKWSEIQEVIQRIDARLQSWRDSLPKQLNIDFDDWTEPDWDSEYTLPRMGLAMLYNSSRMILFRPCLCRFDGRFGGQSSKAKDFNQRAVLECVTAARNTISLQNWVSQSSKQLFSIAPWWQILHYLCEALSILLLELSFKAEHMPNDTAYILEDAKKGVSWLAKMAGRSVSARKAWEIYDILIKAVAPMIKWSTFDMPNEAPCPPGYRHWRFADPPTQLPLSQSNPNQYYSPQQPIYSNEFATTAWANNPGHETYLMNPQSMMPNSLDNEAALERFNGSWSMRNRFDDPWQHLFNLSRSVGTAGRDPNQAGQGEVVESGLSPGFDAQTFLPTYEFGSGFSSGSGGQSGG
ncbi:fungal-specific transcription factor domain-containing protein [Bisporella sp. PMI_857]|nr:fungal-specific transcription factor domain-containing protein [Bisporella sp. PMI_857]